MTPAESAEELARQAAALDAEAIRVREESAQGRELRARAAELRVRAIGERIYPVVVCTSCFRVTGWTDAAGRCDDCLRHEQTLAAYADPHGDFVVLADVRQAPPARPAPPLRSRLAAIVGRGEERGRAADHEWLALVEPDETGPISPEAGYLVEVARRDEIAAADGSATVVIRFTTTSSRFDGAAWERLETTRIGHADILVPAELSAGLPIEQLSEAWGDYGNAVHAFNRSVWAREREAREQQRQAAQATQDTLEQQQHVIELLREEG